jgi:hypothetical protein
MVEVGSATLTDWSEDMYAESNQPQSSYEYHPQQQIVRCANCDIEILWSPTVAQGKSYCCTGCAAGGPCNCDYSQYRSVTIAGIIHYTPEWEAEQP